MSRAAEVELSFGGADRLFRLPIGRIRAIQEKCDAGLMELLNRYALGHDRIDDTREVILQGLIGGGMVITEAQKLIEAFFDPPEIPKRQFTHLAQAIVSVALFGVPDEPPGETEAVTA
ncbi:gene transfer agent family protein [Asticcacaulis excentricus]|uniref:Gene transfer agent family protein n=1 Tax=Asticcacaulis excentricus (strain ATCC 15261 / DSM 4724 / KCTC 12464 / NCIMB 9791 / VKM B-1370 / CB 48) TaxID=573065 RepID=E8RPR0_ASTEC|nr:gene transfer agent family protein [Asticcacaulis excentricus]ADU12037.1 Protein of unknown function DUF3356 [Asticcacaulis excentricus CB 48]